MKALITGIAFVPALVLSAQDSTAIGRDVPSIPLPNVDGRSVSFASFPEAKGFIVVFTCNHCPFAKLYTERLNALQARFAPQDVPLIAINSMDRLVYGEETFALMQARAQEAQFTFPYVQDSAQQAVRAFGAEHTPQAYVVWKEKGKWIIHYSGAIDNNGMEPEKATPFVAHAVDDLLAGRPVAAPVTESFGCRIFLRAADQ